jgi:hypothetical protein
MACLDWAHLETNHCLEKCFSQLSLDQDPRITESAAPDGLQSVRVVYAEARYGTQPTTLNSWGMTQFDFGDHVQLLSELEEERQQHIGKCT